MSPAPRIGVVIVHFGADELTRRCLRALGSDRASPPTRLVLVENGPGTTFAEAVRAELPAVEVVGAGTNLGFAAGCNLGIRLLDDSDMVALVNSDVVVTPGWLVPLVEALEADPHLGAACPKILFEGVFHALEVSASSTDRLGGGDRREVGWQLRQVRVGAEDVTDRCHLASGFWEPEGSGTWAGGRAVLHVPAGSGEVAHIDMWVPATGQRLSMEPSGQVLHPPAGASTQVVALPDAPVRVINNVGNAWRRDGYGVDLGFQEIDRGQHDAPGPVPAWCGGAVLLRAQYLAETGGFDERLFLYYEDLELGMRGAARGWAYRLVPSSVVEHRHAASVTAAPGGVAARRERNRLLVLLRHGPPREVVRSLARFALVTASYVRREVVAPVLQRQPPRWGIPRERGAALLGALALAPAILRSRFEARGREQRRWPDCRPATRARRRGR